MSGQHHYTIAVTQTLEADGVALGEFRATVDVALIQGSGDGWNEPREPAYFEFREVQQPSGPFIRHDKLMEWGEAWVERNQDAIGEYIESKR